jgi:hypothetical protein
MEDGENTNKMGCVPEPLKHIFKNFLIMAKAKRIYMCE